MTNSDILDTLEITAKLLELHDGDANRVKTYSTISYSLGKVLEPLAAMSLNELTGIQGVGKLVAQNIRELVDTGQLKELNDLLLQTPDGLLDLFKIKGLGVKKIKILWKELGLDNLNDLQIACENGLIATVKGFGIKTQEAILASLAFLQSQAGKLRMDKAADIALDIQDSLAPFFTQIEIVGEVARYCEVASCIQLLVVQDVSKPITIVHPDFVEDFQVSQPFIWRGQFKGNQILVEIHAVSAPQFVASKLQLTAHTDHLSYVSPTGRTLQEALNTDSPRMDEKEYYDALSLPYILPEMREGLSEWAWAQAHKVEELVTWESLKGTLHNHSTYSDGKHSLREMAEFCRGLGLSYFGIADHSQTAAYANGLSPERVKLQWAEIDALNAEWTDFRILKGIESDILGDGSLDYPDELLAGFDYVVASVHQNLSMDIVKATDRLIKAIAHPATTILGHPTGRLLLSRNGYPIDYKAIIDACAAYQVTMELNASPYRLDLDWRWIPYCMEKGVKISINPDAHEMEGFFDMKYGVAVARKAGLLSKNTYNALSLTEIQQDLLAKKK
ncbi:MAG: PHP domain-containing protein [Spirosomataceae bacterium]